MTGDRLRSLRESRGLTQAELASRAGVSRQLIGAVEAGRHLPRVDAAMRIAAALQVEVAELFAPTSHPVDVLTGSSPSEGSLVRVADVGERRLVASARVGAAGWDVADAVVEGGELRPLRPLGSGVVMAGCEPGLEALERLLREGGVGAVSVSCSTAAAVEVLEAGRSHLAVVHGEARDLPTREGVERFRLCSWQVGLAGPGDAAPGWAEEALSGRVPVVQREPGAGVQAAFERASASSPPGPRVSGHLEAARWAVEAGMPAVTMEPAALAVGALFHPLAVHRAELWVASAWRGEPAVQAALDEVVGRRFRMRLEGVGGYDLTGIGGAAA